MENEHREDVLSPAGPPELEEAVEIKREQFVMSGTGSHFRLCVTDWDQDGVKDLLVGVNDGRIRIVSNTGSETEPFLENGAWLKSGYNDIDVGWNASPRHFDWNSDGRRDLLVGDSDGRVRFFANTGSESAPQFGSSITLNAGYGVLDVGMSANPFPVDWNNDGKHDLVVGGHDGQLHLFRNIGSSASPQLAAGEALTAGYQSIDVETDSQPRVTDWDGDGKKDLLVSGRGSYGAKLSLFLNEGTDANPLFQSETILYSSESYIPYAWRQGWDFCDVNGDGVEDLVKVNADRAISYMPNKGTNFNRIYDETLYMPGSQATSIYYNNMMSNRIVDWDEDGLKDLMLCVKTHDNAVYMIMNTNTEEDPELTGHIMPATVTGKRVGAGFDYDTPEIVDWNNDGKKDILMGRHDGSCGDIYLYLNVGENYDPLFADKQKLTDGYVDVGPREVIDVETADWNSDGRKDLLVGSNLRQSGGCLQYVFLNEGTDAEPSFSSGDVLEYGPVGYESLLTGTNLTVPHVWDYEEDGDPDIIITAAWTSNRLMKYNNHGVPGSPNLMQEGQLEAGYGYVGHVHAVFPDVCDWDEDGRKDLTVCERDGVFFYRNAQENMTSPNEVSGLVVDSVTETTASLKWTNPSDDDFAGVIIARAFEDITWKPSDRQHYHVNEGVETAPGVEIVYRGDEDHSTVPWTDEGLLPGHFYHYRIFTCDKVLPAYSIDGVQIVALTNGDTVTPTFSPTPTDTPTPTATATPTPVGEPEFGNKMEITREVHIIPEDGWRYRPWATDWDKDGKMDLLTGCTHGYVRLCINSGSAQNPQFQDAGRLNAGYSNIDVGDHSSPVHYDWNSDGKRDLLIGNAAGQIEYLENQGSDTVPVFAGSNTLQAGYGVLDVDHYAEPFPVDWNNDGKDDLLVGGHGGHVHLFLNVGDQSNPQLDSGTLLQVGYQNIDIGRVSRPWVTDWNGDGMKDLLVEGSDHFSLFINVNTDADPQFNEETVIGHQKQTGIIPYHDTWCFTDMNNDAAEDLLVTSKSGAVMYYPNQGTTLNRVYEKAMYIPGEEPGAMFYNRKTQRVVDWDEDGLKDILLVPKNMVHRHYVVLNSGSSNEPSFTSQLILSTESGRWVGFDSTYMFPEVVDWDNDGRKDILSAHRDRYNSGDVYLFPNIGENYDPEFGDPEKLTAGYIDLGPEEVIGMEVTDWNADGKKDLILASDLGPGPQRNQYIYLNEGTDANPAFTTGSLLQYMHSGYESPVPGIQFCVAHVWDYEEDGDPDILITDSSHQDRVHLFNNIGTPGSPQLIDAGYLEASYGYLMGNYHIAPAVTDWDEDGKKDIVFGENHAMGWCPNLQAQETSPPEAAHFTAVEATSTGIGLAWSNPVVCDLGGIIIVRSESDIVWRPSDRMHYHADTGHDVAPGVTVVYKGSENHSVIPWTDENVEPETLYYYRAFSYDAVLPAYSVEGVQISVTASDNTPTPSPTSTPTSTPTEGPAGEPEFGEGIEIKREAYRVLDHTRATSPNATDWDKDGKIDLICGHHGRIQLAMNIGTVNQPQFQDGSDIQSVYGYVEVGEGASPQHFDWNADGRRDFIIGDFYGNVFYYQNFGDDDAPEFRNGDALYAGYSILDVGLEAEPFAVDWDNDGRNDLVVGARDGKVRLFRNVGTAANPQLDSGALIYVGYEPIQMDDDSNPWVVDWNGDGRKDLVVSSSYPYSFSFFENINTDADPAFSEETVLYHEGSAVRLASNIDWALADMNGDSAQDILSATGDTAVLYYPNKGTNTNRIYYEAEYIPGDEPTEMFRRNKVPRVVDWDEDGLKDLLLCVGSNDDHYVVFNNGTQTEPKFTGHLRLATTTGRQIGFTAEYHCSEIIDWNNDGKKDLLVARHDYSNNGDVYLFLNTNENYEPRFGNPEKLSSGYSDLGPNRVYGIEVSDWNDDGKKDLFLGTINSPGFGYLQYVYLNEGTDAAPEFFTGEALQYGAAGYESPLPGDWISVPHIWDYEEDAVPDIVMTTAWDDTRLTNFSNQGTPGFPDLIDGGFLTAGYGYIEGVNSISPEVTDWDEDGKKDILIGNPFNLVYYPNNQDNQTSPPDPYNFNVHDTAHNLIELTWSNPADLDFAGVLIVRSESPITWRPSDRQHYHVLAGTEVAPGVSVVYKGAEDYSSIPWTDADVQAGVTYHYRAFSYDLILPSYSVEGAQASTQTLPGTPTPIPTVTLTPTLTPEQTPTLTPVPTFPPVPALGGFGIAFIATLMGLLLTGSTWFRSRGTF